MPVGGLLFGQVLVCGGGVLANRVDRRNNSYHADCQWLGPKTGNIKMREKRFSASSIFISKQNGNEQKLWVTGGEVGRPADKFYKILQTTEFVSPLRQFAGEQAVQHEAEREHIGLKLGPPHSLFGGNVIDRS